MKQKGFSLLEAMMACAMMCLVLWAVSEFIPAQKRWGMLQDENLKKSFSRIILQQLLIAKIQNAGYMGCLDMSEHTAAPKPLQIFYAHGASWHPALPALLKNKVMPGSDVLAIHASALPGVLVQAQKDDKILSVLENFLAEAGQSLIISNCLGADFITLHSRENQRLYLTETSSLSQDYQPGTLFLSDAAYFYLAKTGRKNSQQQDSVALYYHPINGARQEWFEGLSAFTLTAAVFPQSEKDYHQTTGAMTHLRIKMRFNDEDWHFEVAAPYAE